MFYLQILFLTIYFSFLGMIRLPKATKNAVKNRLIPRPSLINIVKELGIASVFNSNQIEKLFNIGKNEHTLPLMIRHKSQLFGTMLYLKTDPLTFQI